MRLCLYPARRDAPWPSDTLRCRYHSDNNRRFGAKVDAADQIGFRVWGNWRTVRQTRQYRIKRRGETWGSRSRVGRKFWRIWRVEVGPWIGLLLWDGMFCIIEMLINYAGAVIALPALPSLAGDILDGTCDSLDRPMYLANEAIAEAARFRSALGAIASVGVRG
jgi:hypothetical protein